MASVFCPHHGLFTVTFRTTTPSHLVGASVHPGAFVNVGPSNKTRLQSSNATITGRRNSLAPANCSGEGFLLFFFRSFRKSSPFIASFEGHHVFPSGVTAPPDASKSFHCRFVIFSFLTGRQYCPLP